MAKLYVPRLSRREFIRITRDAAAAIALGSMPSFAGQSAPRLRSNPFTLGIASGDPFPDGVVLWTRLDRDVLGASGALDKDVPVAWEIAADEKFNKIVQKGSNIAPQNLGHSVHVEVDGLQPERDYWYRFLAGGEVSAIGRTRTAPDPATSVNRFRFAFVSCQNYEHGYFTAYRHLAKEELELVVHLGDYIYEGTSPANGAKARQHEAGETFTLDQYRARYSLYKRDADLQAAHAAAPWIVTPDDHEVSNNYANAISERNTPPEEFLLRRAAAYQAYYEFMPLRRESMPSGPTMRLYRRLRFGDLATFHVLDTRQHRTDQPCGDGVKPRCEDALNPAQTMMGPEQEEWLMDGLRARTLARWNVLANQVIIAQNIVGLNGKQLLNMDSWDGYVEARNRLTRFLAEARPSNPVVITGDIHSNWVADLKVDFDRPSSPTVATEFVGTSIASGGDGSDSDAPFVRLDWNPHIKFHNNRRGYVRCTLTPSVWTSDFRVVPYVSKPGAPVETRATFVVENAKPGAQRSSS
jgi:alkaline phosphatase D